MGLTALGAAVGGLHAGALAAAAFAVFAGGFAAGAVGVGGVLAVPAMLAAGVEAHAAVGSIMPGFVLASAVGASLYLGPAARISAAAGIGAFASTFAVVALPQGAFAAVLVFLGACGGARVLVGVLAHARGRRPVASDSPRGAGGGGGGAGQHDCEELASRAAEDADEAPLVCPPDAEEPAAASSPPREAQCGSPAPQPPPPPPADGRRCDSWHWDAPIGVLAGFASGATGTAGPFALMPILLCSRSHYSAAESVGICLAVGVPVGMCAGVGHVLYGKVDLALSAALGVLLAGGMPLGKSAGQRLPPNGLRCAVGVALLAAAAIAGARLLLAVV
eukprot:TRINITY_DN7669_c0_g2_i2.p2 TRINITY_DN7669_c0_g2~~TRINITY_DN7669_c0_g2_i2.p2  ORF type:complete len:334 (+),score=75.51 TRINITY_DN7669_c0_g2_i2:64-1065(+)